MNLTEYNRIMEMCKIQGQLQTEYDKQRKLERAEINRAQKKKYNDNIKQLKEKLS